MAAHSRETPVGLNSDLGELPLDPDLEQEEDDRHGPTKPQSGPFDTDRRSRWPRIHWRSVAVIGAGAFVGGLTRYGIGLAWTAPSGTFPWATFAINTSGAFVLALLLVLVLEVLPPTTYLRPALGTGFCGAYTTFSSVATASDQLIAHGHANVAAGYMAASLFTGLAAASFGIVIGRSIAANQARRTEDP
jgi:fluoride exporter